jgi:hypothetical protein
MLKEVLLPLLPPTPCRPQQQQARRPRLMVSLSNYKKIIVVPIYILIIFTLLTQDCVLKKNSKNVIFTHVRV